MGSFFTNFHVRSESVAEVVRSVTPLVERRAYVSPPRNGWITIYDEASDDQDDAIIRRIASGVSKALQTSVVAFLVHDSDIAAYWIYQNGQLNDEFNSAPDYFGAKVSAQTAARVRGNTDTLLPLCTPETTRAQVEAVLHPPGGFALMGEDIVSDIGELLGLDESRRTLGFRYFEEEGAGILPDIAEFEPVGGAERIEAGESDVLELRLEGAGSQPLDAFCAAITMLTQTWTAPQQFSTMMAAAGESATQEMLRKLCERFDRSARDMLKHSKIPDHPDFDELKAARDAGPEALAQLLARRVPDQLTDIGVGAAATKSTLFIMALMKHGLDPKKIGCQGMSPLQTAEKHGKNSTIYQIFISRT
jgi:hypothetical protein